MKIDTANFDLTSGHIPKQVRKLFIPVSIGLFFNVLFNVVDTWFGGQISPTTLASLSLTFPLFLIVLALSFGFSTGSSALIATKIGQKKQEEAKIIYCQAIGIGVIISILLTILSFFICKPLLQFLGANGEYLKDALDYILIIYAGSITIVTISMINAGLSAVGENRPNRNFLILSFFANIGLDYWFIKGGLGIPPLGIVGIALSTVLLHVFGIFYLLYYVKKTYLLDNVKFNYFIPKLDCTKIILIQGFPATFNMLSLSFYFFILNNYISIFGQNAIAAYGVGLRIEQLILVPGIGISVAITTLVAQNHGAMLENRVKKIIKIGFFYSLGLMGIGAILLLTLSNLLITFFTDNPEIISIGIGYLTIEAFTLFSYSFIHISSAALQGLKKPNISSLINLIGRFTPLPILAVLITILQFDIFAVWWTILANSFVMGALFVFFLKKELVKAFSSSKTAAIS